MLFCGGVVLIWSCAKSSDQVGASGEKKKVVAKIFDKEIYASDLFVMPGSVKKKEDSVAYVRAYLDKLALEKALLYKALGSGLVDMGDIEARTNEFRNTLINLRFENEYIKLHLDSNFSKPQLEDYYDKNKMSFILDNDIIKAYYVVVPATIPKLDKLKEIMVSDKPQNFEELKSFCLRYANTFSLDANLWITLPSPLKGTVARLNEAKASKRIVAFEKEEYLYLVRVFDYKFSKQQSPLSYVEENIKRILLNKRKMEMLSQLNAEALNEAKQSDKIEIY